MRTNFSTQRINGQRPIAVASSRTSRLQALRPQAAASAPRSTSVSKVDPFAKKTRANASAVVEAPARTQAPIPVETRRPTTVPAKATDAAAGFSEKKWMWRGHKINFLTAGCGDPIVLIHGFGLCGRTYRKTIKELSKNYKVYAIDLLGFGKSDKPILQSGYTMELWRDLVLDFMAEFTSGRATTLVGNSIGGLTALMVAADAPADSVRGLVLLNTAGAMNNKGLLGDWRIMMAYPLLMLVDFVLSVPQWAHAIFKNVKSRESIRKALLQVYSNAESVTDELVDIIYAPSCDRNAREVFVSVFTGPPGPKPFALVPRIEVPILTLWGEDDKLTPADGPVGRYFQELPNERPNTTFKFLPGVGHCLHDDRPEVVHAELVPWLDHLHSDSSSACESERCTDLDITLPDFPTAPVSSIPDVAARKVTKASVQA